MEFNLVGEYVSLLFAFILILFTRKFKLHTSSKNRLFRLCFVYVFIEIILSILSIYFIEASTTFPVTINYIIQTLYYLSAPFTIVLFLYYVLAILFEEEQDLSRILWVSTIPFFLHAVFILTNPFHNLLFSIDSVNGYVENEWFLLSFFIAFFYELLIIALLVIHRKQQATMFTLILLSFPIMMMSLFVFQWIFPHIILTGSSAVAALLIIYAYLQYRLIIVDDLTGLHNRESFVDQLGRMIRVNSNAYIVVVSLDEFKQINERFGETVANSLLVSIAAFLRENCPNNTGFRFSGVEFACLSEDLPKQELDAVVKALEKRFRDAWVISELSLHIDVNIAVIPVTNCPKTVQSILSLMSFCIDVSKHKKDHRTIYANEAIVLEFERKNEIVKELAMGLTKNYCTVHFQPIYDPKSSSFKSAEALLRFHSPMLGNVPPSELIPILEETGVINDVGEYVLDEACKFLVSLRHDGIELDTLSVNLSVTQLYTKGFVERCIHTIRRNSVKPEQIAFEITESIFINQPQLVLDIISQLHSEHIRFHLDDFGTGFSNLTTLMRFPFDAVKIDKSILYESFDSTVGQNVLQGFCDTFQRIGMKVIIEGVETESQNERMIGMNVDRIQGFYYSRPGPVNQITSFLTAQSKSK